MNILFFLTPKKDVAYVFDDDTLRQVMEKMEYHKYSCIPMISIDGKYVGTITEGDLLWGIKNQQNLNLRRAETIPITKIPRRTDYQPVHIECNMEDLIDKAMNQNFVPVVDDQNNFIGIITRKDLIQYCYRKMDK
ncbi:CBS domain-containing protein [Lactonifactor longoviformis]|uniref:CBS domain-containing protein n=1 Tax=Lactonifactor longoviformis DSM 17459 TaxID=1122155 RepID=A0A1M5AX94_9CLOT|nr:CBS domain-containing protein [Lactonifactor longoviformis]POP30372.1 CBS domain-containing protein [Lactonifactor longoviformis]SHF34901.1 CBS domain-containing protein [Lactonifactor longoviformis DSM 17459]